MVMPKGKRESLTADHWTRAALVAVASGGLPAVAVEPLAKELGATKGSFYWHFADREALVEATLQLWERRDTDEVIAAIDETQDAETRLRNLLRLAFTSVLDRSAGGARTVELALQASASHPLVSAALRRVTERRLTLLTQLYTELGLSTPVARDRGLLAYTAFLGHVQLAHATPGLLPAGRAFTAHVEQVVEALLDLGGSRVRGPRRTRPR
jgi:AcrR family transcriptional regulator